MDWTPAFPLDQITIGHAKLFRKDKLRIAIFRTSDAEIYAVDDRCPHEGYPLTQGVVCGKILTCSWHNFKFNLVDGHCVQGEEHVRSWPVRIVAGQVEVDLSPPDPQALQARAFESLEAGTLNLSLGQMARDVVRLLSLGVSADAIALFTAAFDGNYGEWGPSHALALSFDGLEISDRFEGVDKALPLMQALDMTAQANQRRPKRVFTGTAVDAPPDVAIHTLRMLVETEKAEEAARYCDGMLAAGMGRAVMVPALLSLCADHFLDFGHALIYSTKSIAFLDRVGWSQARAILPALIFGITNGTREELLPAWAAWRKRLAALDMPALYAVARPQPLDTRTLQAAILDGSASEAFNAVAQALETGAALNDIVNVLSLCASERMRRFNIAIDASPTHNEGWLDVTHLLTFSHATRQALALWQDPAALRLIFQATRFINNARPLDGVAEPIPECSPSLEDFWKAVQAKHTAVALGLARALWAAGQHHAMQIGLEDLALGEAATRPIIVAHLLKTTRVAFTEAQILGNDAPILAVARLFATPVAERRLRRLVHDAIRLVQDGLPPEKLT